MSKYATLVNINTHWLDLFSLTYLSFVVTPDIPRTPIPFNHPWIVWHSMLGWSTLALGSVTVMVCRLRPSVWGRSDPSCEMRLLLTQEAPVEGNEARQVGAGLVTGFLFMWTYWCCQNSGTTIGLSHILMDPRTREPNEAVRGLGDLPRWAWPGLRRFVWTSFYVSGVSLLVVVFRSVRRPAGLESLGDYLSCDSLLLSVVCCINYEKPLGIL